MRKSPGGPRGRTVRWGPSSPCPSPPTWPPSSSRRAILFLPSQPSPPLLGNSRPCAEESEPRRRAGRISADRRPNRADPVADSGKQTANRANRVGGVRIRRRVRRKKPSPEFSVPSDSFRTPQTEIFFPLGSRLIIGGESYPTPLATQIFSARRSSSGVWTVLSEIVVGCAV